MAMRKYTIFQIFVIFLICLQNGIHCERFNDLIVKFIVDVTPVLLPPTRLSLHLCIEKEEEIKLSRELSKNNLLHDFRTISNDLDPWIHDNLEHKNLYVLNLDCSGAIDILHKANESRMFIAPTKWLIYHDINTLIDKGIDSDDFVHEIFKDLAIYPDSDVILARGIDQYFIEILSPYRPSPYRGLIIENRGNWTSIDGLRMKNHHAVSRRRKDLQLTPLKSCLVMTDPETIDHLTDYQEKHVDPVTKANYPWVLHIMHRINATVTFNITNTWGYQDQNGSWSGMIGMLQRREIDIGGTGTFFISQRIGVVKYVQLYTRTGSRFVFKKPLLSSVSNIFSLPFQRSVWLAVAVFLVLVFVLLYVSMKWEYRQGASKHSAEYWSQINPAEPTISDNLLVLLGAVAQQGYSYEPYRVPSRIVTLMLLIASLSLYTSYTANIVALLQSTTDSIRTLADLLSSPLKLGAQDVVYNRYYFQSFQDPIRTAIRDKIESKGKKSSWMTIEEGVNRVRSELFAFHGEVGTMYKIMQDTYQEDEKCGLTEIDFLNVLYPLMVVQVQSPYLELIKNGALLLRESGLKFREEYRLYTEKPVCQGQTSFISIGTTECYFALVAMAYGMLLTLFVFILEIIWSRRKKSSNRDIVQNNELIDTIN